MPTRHSLAAGLAVFALAVSATPHAAVAVAAADAAKAKADFAAARDELRECVAELTTLQAEYQKPGADKPTIEANFNAAKTRAQAANDRLEASAFEAIAADPSDESVLDVCGTLLAVATQKDDPTTVLARAKQLDSAGVKNGDIAMMAADAAVKLSRLDDAEAWLKKAEEAGVDKQKVAGLMHAIEHDRPKVEKEMAARAEEAKADDLPRVKITT